MQPAQILLAVQIDTLGRGVAIAFAGLLIVFVALLLISLFIATLPRVLVRVARVWPEIDEPSVVDGQAESRLAEDESRILAAIGFVLHTELRRELAAEQASFNRKD